MCRPWWGQKMIPISRPTVYVNEKAQIHHNKFFTSISRIFFLCNFVALVDGQFNFWNAVQLEKANAYKPHNSDAFWCQNETEFFLLSRKASFWLCQFEATSSIKYTCSKNNVLPNFAYIGSHLLVKFVANLRAATCHFAQSDLLSQVCPLESRLMTFIVST